MNIDFSLMRTDEIDEMVEFVARLNRITEHRVTYLGTETDDIRAAIVEDMTDLPPEKAILLGRIDGRLAAVWGVEYDAARGKGYSWGPFVDHPDWAEVAGLMWDELLRTMPDTLVWMQLALDSRNQRAIEFAESLGFGRRRVDHLLLRLACNDHEAHNHDDLIEVDREQQAGLAALHDKIFPTTYFDGAELVSRLNETRRAFVNREVTGYVYGEVRPEVGFGGVDFVGVDEAARGSGLAGRLLNRALTWIFSHPTIPAVELTVADGNPAERIYTRAGFKRDLRIVAFERTIIRD